MKQWQECVFVRFVYMCVHCAERLWRKKPLILPTDFPVSGLLCLNLTKPKSVGIAAHRYSLFFTHSMSLSPFRSPPILSVLTWVPATSNAVQRLSTGGSRLLRFTVWLWWFGQYWSSLVQSWYLASTWKWKELNLWNWIELKPYEHSGTEILMSPCFWSFQDLLASY